MAEDLFKLTLEDKLYRTKYEPDSDHPHISVNDELCAACADKPCVSCCPAEVYKTNPNDERLVTVSHDNCLECGTCVQVCEPESVDWRFPDGAMGVKYRYG